MGVTLTMANVLAEEDSDRVDDAQTPTLTSSTSV
jgi:hypothetical protein